MLTALCRCVLSAASFLYNNCKALRAGVYSYTHLNQPALLGPPARGRPSPAAGGGSGGGGSGAASAAAAAEPRVLGTNSEHSDGAIINLVVQMSS